MKLRLHSTALDGRTVTLTLMQDGVTAGPLTIDAWGAALPAGPDAGSIDVSVHRSALGCAPEAVFFDVTGWTGFETTVGENPDHYDARDHDILYLWDFGDPGAAATAPVNVLAEWRDLNVGHGPYVMHVYDAPGSYTATCLAVEPSTGRTARFSTTITVVAATAVPGMVTAYVDPDADYAAAPAGALPFPTLGRAIQSFRSRTTPVRILLARGKTHLSKTGDNNSDPHETGFRRGTMTAIHIAAGPGSGALPIVKQAPDASGLFGAHSDWKGTEITFDRIVMDGEWDSTTETMAPGKKLMGALSIWADCRLTFNKGTFRGFSGAVGWLYGSIENTMKRFMAINDTVVTSWQDYGFFHGGCANVGIVGTRIAQPELNRAGGDKGTTARSYNQHGPIRFDGGGTELRRRAYIDGCDLFTSNGWFPNYDFYRTAQPCLRWNQSQYPRHFLNLQRTSLEGGHNVLWAGAQNDGIVSQDQSVLVDHCVFVASHMTQSMLGNHGGGLTARNTMFIVPDTPREAFTLEAFIGSGINASRAYPLAGRVPVKTYSNTYINLQTRTDRLVPRLRISYTPNAPVIDENYVDHQPNASPAQVAFAPLDATPLWTPREKGPQNSWQLVKHTFAAAFAPGQTISVPYPAGTVGADFPAGTNLTVTAAAGLTFAHGTSSFSVTNGGTKTFAAGETTSFYLDRGTNPLPRKTHLATPADTVWSGTPLAGSAARGGATSDLTGRDDLRGRTRPVHPSAGAVEA